jgi:hypothetical protein
MNICASSLGCIQSLEYNLRLLLEIAAFYASLAGFVPNNDKTAVAKSLHCADFIFKKYSYVRFLSVSEF